MVERLAGETDPVRAVIELIWNSLDADANEEYQSHSTAMSRTALYASPSAMTASA
ncbi:hypothetical protein [Changpingibacter yushuensis]|uniref:hypothetical protein n=1 Tax=Changpingibacter yushuensis TaxID=2758440 RepID=UPI00165D7BAD|nr:hypothetical protein [Changpingibacter yushuensis]